MTKVVVLTGAGISAESGLATFPAQDGLWVDFKISDVATPQAFAKDQNWCTASTICAGLRRQKPGPMLPTMR